MKLPKSIIKKYGITSKAWSVFRNSKKTKRRGKGKMAKKRHYRGGARMKSSTKAMVGGLLYATIGEPLLDMAADKVGLNIQDDFVKGIGGFMLTKVKNKYVSAVGNAALIIAVNNVAKNQLGQLNLFGLGNKSTSSNSNSSSGDGW